MNKYSMFYELEVASKPLFFLQKHSPSGIIELKDVRRVTDLNGDGVFRVRRVTHTHTHTHTHTLRLQWHFEKGPSE